MRVQAKPTHRAGASLRFRSFAAAARAVRALSQAGLYPSNCRILDPNEAYNTGAGDGAYAIMALAFESADHPLDAWMARALQCCADHGGAVEPENAAAGLWRTAFIRMPYAREFLTPAGLIVDTFETAITWDRFDVLHESVKSATERAILEATGMKGEVTCRFTHVYPDGPAPYFSFHALGRHGALLEQWRAIKQAASDALLAAGGTITHHHAVGRDHRPWYDKQRPDLFALALRAAKRALDPKGVMNPGVLIDP
jgi:alkyldihydroxyacetonephosphate synthase